VPPVTKTSLRFPWDEFAAMAIPLVLREVNAERRKWRGLAEAWSNQSGQRFPTRGISLQMT
jgi:hypothetical protein